MADYAHEDGRIKEKHHILGLIETGLSCSCLEQLGWFAGRDPKDCTMGHITENPPVSSTLGLGGRWRSERSKFLSLDGRRWGCLNRWLLSYWGLNLLGREMENVPKQRQKEKQTTDKHNQKCHMRAKTELKNKTRNKKLGLDNLTCKFGTDTNLVFTW